MWDIVFDRFFLEGILRCDQRDRRCLCRLYFNLRCWLALLLKGFPKILNRRSYSPSCSSWVFVKKWSIKALWGRWWHNNPWNKTWLSFQLISVDWKVDLWQLFESLRVLKLLHPALLISLNRIFRNSTIALECSHLLCEVEWEVCLCPVISIEVAFLKLIIICCMFDLVCSKYKFSCVLKNWIFHPLLEEHVHCVLHAL